MKKSKPVTYKDAREVVEATVPTMLMLAMTDLMEQAGYEMRQDMKEGLQLSLSLDLTSCKRLHSERAQKKLESILPTLMRELPNDTAQEALMTGAVLLLNLVDKGMYRRKDSGAVLVALALKEEAEKDPEMWQVSWERVAKSADRVFSRCRFDGLYLTPTGPQLQ